MDLAAPTEGGRLRARWTDLASLGLLLAAAGPLLLLIAVLAWGLDTEGETGFFAVAAGVPLVAGVLVRRFGTWAKVIGAIAGLLVAFALFWTAFGLSYPNSFFEFLPGLLVIPGGLLALVASISAIVAKRRGHVGERPVGGEKKAITTAIGIVAVVALVSGILTFVSRSSVGAEGSKASATAVMTDFEFVPTSYSVAGGTKILVRNDDPFLHTFTVDELDIDVAVTVGSEKLISIPSRPGTYFLYCKPHTEDKDDPGEDDMVARLTIT